MIICDGCQLNFHLQVLSPELFPIPYTTLFDYNSESPCRFIILNRGRFCFFSGKLEIFWVLEVIQRNINIDCSIIAGTIKLSIRKTIFKKTHAFFDLLKS